MSFEVIRMHTEDTVETVLFTGSKKECIEYVESERDYWSRFLSIALVGYGFFAYHNDQYVFFMEVQPVQKPNVPDLSMSKFLD